MTYTLENDSLPLMVDYICALHLEKALGGWSSRHLAILFVQYLLIQIKY